MKKTFAPALLAILLVSFTLMGIWDATWLAFQAFSFVVQVKETILRPPKAPTWKPRSTEEGKHPKNIQRGELALGVRSDGDYAPLILAQSDGAIRAAGKNVQTGPDWVSIAVDKQGRVICSPQSIAELAKHFRLKPGEKIIIQGPPVKVEGFRVE